MKTKIEKERVKKMSDEEKERVKKMSDEEKERVKKMSDEALLGQYSLHDHLLRNGTQNDDDVQEWLVYRAVYRAEILRRMRTGK